MRRGNIREQSAYSCLRVLTNLPLASQHTILCDPAPRSIRDRLLSGYIGSGIGLLAPPIGLLLPYMSSGGGCPVHETQAALTRERANCSRCTLRVRRRMCMEARTRMLLWVLVEVGEGTYPQGGIGVPNQAARASPALVDGMLDV